VAFVAWGKPLGTQIVFAGMLVVWAIFATRYAVWNRKCADNREDGNDYVELARGGLFGFVALCILYYLQATK